MKKINDNVFSINMNNYIKPDTKQLLTQSGEYVTNGRDNEYFYFVEDRYIGSPTNASIIDSYSNYIYGEGLLSSIDGFKNILRKGDIKLIIKDLKMHGAFSLHIVYSLDRSEITNIYHLPVRSIAIAKQEDITDEPNAYYYSFDWRDKYKFPPRLIPAFGTSESFEEIAYFRIPSPQPLFSLPDYQSGLQYAMLEEELSNFYISHIKNNFSAGKIINIHQGVGDEDVMLDAKRKIINDLSGSSNAGNIIVAFSDNKENATTVDDIQIVDAYQQFEWLSSEARDKILMAHKVVNPILFGVRGGEGLSNNADEMNVALKTLYRSQINPLREIFIDALEEIYYEIGVNAVFEFKDFDELVIKKEEENNII